MYSPQAAKPQYNAKPAALQAAGRKIPYSFPLLEQVPHLNKSWQQQV